MKKIRYTEDLLKIIFFWLGIAFVAMGLLALANILKPTADSRVQDPMVMGIIFSSLGAAFLVVCVVLRALGSSKWKLHCELLEHGTRVNGTVEKVYMQTYTQYGRQCPYRIRYTFSSQGHVYHHTSHLLWETPDYVEQDPIVVYVNDMGKSAISC